jgi:hypothetical protein
MSIILAGGEKLIIKGMQAGQKLQAVFIVSPAFAKMYTDNEQDYSVVALGDVLALEADGLIVRDESNPLVNFTLTDAGRAWTEDVDAGDAGDPPQGRDPQDPRPTPTPTPVAKSEIFFLKYWYIFVIAAVAALFIASRSCG